MLIRIFAAVGFLLTSIYARNSDVLIVYTNNTNGVLENCRCPQRSYGALEKRAALIDSLRKINANLLLVDCGDILDIRPNSLMHSYIIKAYGIIRYDAWTPGDQDFIEGVDFFQESLAAIPGQLVSANIRLDGRKIGRPWWIKEIAGIKFAITGIIDPGLLQYLPDSIAGRITIEPPEKVLENLMPEICSASDVIILLSHAGMDRDRKIADRFPEIDLIFGGHSQTITEHPDMVGNTAILQAGEGGNRVGLLQLQFEKGKISSYHNTLHLLHRNERDDPKVLDLIAEFHRERMKAMHGIEQQ